MILLLKGEYVRILDENVKKSYLSTQCEEIRHYDE